MKTNSPEFRQMQRERILKNKPWLKSTGPKTARGKETSKMNALKINIKLYYLIKRYKDLMMRHKEIRNTIDPHRYS